MEATLKFNLPEEQEEFEIAVNGVDYHSFIFDFNNFLRGELKYKSDDKGEDYIKALEMVKKAYTDMLIDYKITLL